MQFELPSVSKLANLTKIIHVEETTQVTNTKSFDNQQGCILDIRVHTNSLQPVLVRLANELVEFGVATNGVYQVQIFKKVPFPVEMYPVLSIFAEGEFTISYTVVRFDKLLHHAIYNFGAYCKISNLKYIHMYQRYIQVTSTAKSEIYNYPNAQLSDHIVIKCSKFHDIAKTPGLEWIEPMLLPGIGAKYAHLGNIKQVPCLIFSKDNAVDFLHHIEKNYPNTDIRISAELPSRVMEKNKYLVGNVLNTIKQSVQ